MELRDVSLVTAINKAAALIILLGSIWTKMKRKYHGHFF